MRYLLLLPVMLALAFPAQAGGNNNGPKASANAGAAAGAAAGALAGSQSSTSVAVEGDETEPAAYAPDPAVFRPTAPCMVPASGTLGVMGLVSLGGAGGYVNADCQELEDAKALCSLAQQYKEHKGLQEHCIDNMMMAVGRRSATAAKPAAPVATKATPVSKATDELCPGHDVCPIGKGGFYIGS